MRNCFNLIRNYKLEFLIKAGIKEIKRKIWREKIKNSYSQNYEDLIIDKLLNKKRGKYLEIRAYHPTRLSNTYRFYKKGWRGIVIEPNPEVKFLFEKYRPRDKYLGVGISNKNKKLNYYQFLIPALNTFSKINANQSIKKGHKLVGVKKINTKNIKEIAEKNIDFLSVDTEGFDELILKSWPWNKYYPKVICVEDEGININYLLKNKGYILKDKTKSNSIYFQKLKPWDGRRQ